MCNKFSELCCTVRSDHLLWHKSRHWKSGKKKRENIWWIWIMNLSQPIDNSAVIFRLCPSGGSYRYVFSGVWLVYMAVSILTKAIATVRVCFCWRHTEHDQRSSLSHIGNFWKGFFSYFFLSIDLIYIKCILC